MLYEVKVKDRFSTSGGDVPTPQAHSKQRQDGHPKPLSNAEDYGGDWSFSNEEKTLPSLGDGHPAVPELTELQIHEAVTRLSQYLREGREYYYAAGQALSEGMVSALKRFFSPALLAHVRTVELRNRRIPNPSFYPEAKSLGFTNLPDLTHKASVTFLDAVVFNESITARNLFHGLVHVAQFQVLGIERYVDLFLHGFLRTKTYFLVPMKAHAFLLDARFAKKTTESFSVEEEVERWVREGLY